MQQGCCPCLTVDEVLQSCLDQSDTVQLLGNPDAPFDTSVHPHAQEYRLALVSLDHATQFAV